jgi:hypothetical protein
MEPLMSSAPKTGVNDCQTYAQAEAAEWRWLEGEVAALIERAKKHIHHIAGDEIENWSGYLTDAKSDARFSAEKLETANAERVENAARYLTLVSSR